MKYKQPGGGPGIVLKVELIRKQTTALAPGNILHHRTHYF